MGLFKKIDEAKEVNASLRSHVEKIHKAVMEVIESDDINVSIQYRMPSYDEAVNSKEVLANSITNNIIDRAYNPLLNMYHVLKHRGWDEKYYHAVEIILANKFGLQLNDHTRELLDTVISEYLDKNKEAYEMIPDCPVQEMLDVFEAKGWYEVKQQELESRLASKYGLNIYSHDKSSMEPVLALYFKENPDKLQEIPMYQAGAINW